MKNTDRLGTEKVGKLLFEFSAPAVVATLVNATYNIVDRIFIGQGIGPLAIAGISISFPVMILYIAFGMLVGVGGSALISLSLGEHKVDKAEQILGNAFSLSLLITVILTIFGFIFLEPVLYFLGATENTIGYATEYMRIIIFSIFFNFVSFGMSGYIRAEGNPNIAMYTILVGAAVNCILDPIFIFVFCWGVKGAAYATFIANVISAAVVLYHFTFSKQRVLSLRIQYLKFSPKLVFAIVSIGMAPFTMQLTTCLVTFLGNSSLLKYGGDLAIAAMGIINSVMMMIVMPVVGISQGLQPLIGYNYGAKQYLRVKRLFSLGIKSAFVISITGFIIIMLFPNFIFNLFGDGNRVVNTIGIPGMRIFLSMIMVAAIQIIGANYFQAIGKARISIFLNLLRQFILFVPLLLILPNLFGLNGVWVVAPISDTCSCFITSIFVMTEFKKLTEKVAMENLLP